MSTRSKKKLRERMNYRAGNEQTNYRGAVISLRAEGPGSLDEKNRSVEVVMSTESPAMVRDWDRGIISEVLLMSGAEVPETKQLVLLDAHSRYETANVIGSVREIRISGDQMIGRAYYSSAPEAESPWIKTREGHLTDYSIGYRVDEAVWVPEGQTATISGRVFTGPVQVATRWTPRELSAVPIGADQNAKARREIDHKLKTIKEESNMDPKIRAMLEAKGLPATATEEQAVAFLEQLEVKTGNNPDNDQERAAQEEKIRKEAKGEELERIREIDALCQRYECADMARELIISGKDVIDAQRAILDAVMERSKKQNPGASGAEFIVAEKDKFRAAAEHGLILRAGMKVDSPAPGADELRGFTLVEIARECLRMSGLPHRGDVKSMVGRAMTSSDFPNILANLATKSMQQGWDDAQETWPIWTGEGSVSDFKTYYDNALSEFDDLEEIKDAGEIKLGGFTEKTPETYKIASYGKKFKVTRVMIINDDLNALTAMPAKRTEAANRKIGDIVYAVITGNGTMGDGVAIFSTASTRLNDATSGYLSAPGIVNIAEGIRVMGTHKDIAGKRRLNIRPQFFVAPKALEGTSEIFFRSDKYSDNDTVATDSSFASTRVNPYSGTYLTRVYEPRLDDDSESAWYLMGPKGRTVKVVFLNGRRGPILEMIQPGFSVEGFEYAVVIDAGAYATDYRGMYRNEGA
ncbi:MAG: hypothetical protein M0R00_04165 [Candidatus Omnitrophica bacterium]|jgi:hypothetical protein|nr:hypothetical protein [Candidatus Omnitrophota bacterium]